MNDAADRAVDNHVAGPQAGREDQLTKTRRVLSQMNAAAERAIDDQVARGRP
jgi:hypothetical protein